MIKSRRRDKGGPDFSLEHMHGCEQRRSLQGRREEGKKRRRSIAVTVSK